MSKILLLSIMLVSFGAVAAETAVDVESVQKILTKKNANWTAKDTWINHLSSNELQRLLGNKEIPPTDVDFTVNEPMGFNAFGRTSLDWRNYNGVNYVSPMLNQANCGSCVAFAAIGTLETQLNVTSAIPGLNIRLSPQALFACGGGGCDSGWYPSSAAAYLQKTGVPDEACAPYTMGATGNDVACNSICSDSASRSLKIAKYTTPTTYVTNLAALRAALAKGPMMTSMTVYADFLVYSSGVYKHTTGASVGGHAISLVGYDDESQSLIIRNSWGEDWGEKGFARISYQDVSGIGKSTWLFEVPSVAGYVAIRSPADYAFIAGNYQLKATSTFPTTSNVDLVIADAGGKVVWTQACTKRADCVATLQTQNLPDGRYEAYARAAWGNKATSTSSHTIFYVANQTPQMSLSFSGQGFDFSKPIKGRVVFDVKAYSKPVPFGSLTFHFKNKATGVEMTRTTKVIASDMTLGWRTNVAANGTYEIWMTGKVTTNLRNASAESAHYTVEIANP